MSLPPQSIHFQTDRLDLLRTAAFSHKLRLCKTINSPAWCLVSPDFAIAIPVLARVAGSFQVSLDFLSPEQRQSEAIIAVLEAIAKVDRLNAIRAKAYSFLSQKSGYHTLSALEEHFRVDRAELRRELGLMVKEGAIARRDRGYTSLHVKKGVVRAA